MSNPTETGAPAVAESADAGKRDLKAVLRQSLQQGLAFGTLIVLFIFFSIANPAFLQWSNISGVLLATAVIGILAVGTTLVIITGGIDLSIGTGMTFAAVITGVTITNFGLPMWVGILAGMATGALMGMTMLARNEATKTRHAGAIYSVYTHPSWRGTGVADALLNACTDYARNLGMRVLHLGVVVNNASALQLYLRNGWSVYGVDPESIFYDGIYYDELMMLKRL